MATSGSSAAAEETLPVAISAGVGALIHTGITCSAAETDPFDPGGCDALLAWGSGGIVKRTFRPSRASVRLIHWGGFTAANETKVSFWPSLDVAVEFG